MPTSVVWRRWWCDQEVKCVVVVCHLPTAAVRPGRGYGADSRGDPLTRRTLLLLWATVEINATGECGGRARLQPAIAPAGTGKTTAPRALTRAWTDSGQVLGLAPSTQRPPNSATISGRRPTHWQLIWSIHHADMPDWALSAGESTLVIIDEAGMADTLHRAARRQCAAKR